MQPADDSALLRQYAENHLDEAFAALVTRHINLVYSVALRRVGNPHHAEEITQTVFLILAKKAVELRHHEALSSWLFQATHLTANNFVRSEIRRARREQEAYMQSTFNETDNGIWDKIAPLLDTAVASLDEKDRRAIVLRFYQGKDMREVGLALDTNEEAARKRVSRAVEKLQRFFAKRGVTSTAAAIVGVISANSVHSAPVGLAATISSAVLTGTAISTSTAITATKIIAMTTLQKIAVTAAFVAAAGAGIYEARQAAQLRDQVQTLQQQQAPLAEQIQQMQSNFADATNRLADLLAENEQLKFNSNGNELLRLRAEVAQLRTATAQNDSSDPADEAAKGVAAKVKQMKQWLVQNPNDQIQELQYLSAQEWLRGANYTRELKTDDDFDRAVSQLRRDAKRTFANSIGEALANYIAANNGQLPGDISQLTPYFNPPIDGAILQRYQLLQTGNLSDLPSNEPLIAERAPVDDRYDTLFTISATGYSYQGTGTPWVNGSGKGGFGTNITAKIKSFERQN